MQSVIAALREADIGEILLNEPLAPYTTWKIGGPADALLIPKTKEKLIETVRILHASGAAWTVLGRGSNTLISEGIRGFVIKLGPALDTLRVEGTTLIAGGAYSFIKLSVMAGKEGLTGLEFAGGIPGSVGGAVYMNAGAHGSDVSRILKRAELVLENGELVTLAREQLEYAYRHSVLHDKLRGIVTEAEFELRYGDRKEIAAALAAYKDRRLRTQPLQLACAGSVFRNPEGCFAAKLIEEAGLKGYRVGGAEVSPLHANFIVNTGQATARDVLSLMEEVQRVVLEKFGVQLNPEVLVVGER
jgi:UDP-N-acetylmuramate dehydrogenase